MGRRRPAMVDLQREGPAVRLTDVAVLSGFSPQKLLADARLGYLQITWAPCGIRRMAMVDRSEAVRYLQQIRAHAS